MTTSPAFVQMLIGTIPREQGATLVARTGERARITSSGGSLDLGSVALTAEVIDDLSAQLLGPDDLQTLHATGVVQAAFVAANGAGDFELVASSNDGNRCLEVRRGRRSTENDSAAPLPTPPSTESLVADLLSRRVSNDARLPKQQAAPLAPEAAVLSSSEPTPIPQLQVTPTTPTAPPLDLHVDATASNGDLDVPTNFEFADSTFNADDLALPNSMVEEQPAKSATEPPRPVVSKPAAAIPTKIPTKQKRAFFGSRQSRAGSLSWLLAAGIGLAVGIPAAGWFFWTGRVSTAQVATPPPRRAIPAPATVVIKPKTPPAAAVDPSPSAPKLGATTVPAEQPQRPTVESRPVASSSPSRAVAVAAAPTNAATDAARTRDGFSVQVAAVHTRDEADRMAAKLITQKYPAYVVKGEGAAADFYRVRIGAFPSRDVAEQTARQIETTEGSKPWIVKETR